MAPHAFTDVQRQAKPSTAPHRTPLRHRPARTPHLQPGSAAALRPPANRGQHPHREDEPIPTVHQCSTIQRLGPLLRYLFGPGENNTRGGIHHNPHITAARAYPTRGNLADLQPPLTRLAGIRCGGSPTYSNDPGWPRPPGWCTGSTPTPPARTTVAHRDHPHTPNPTLPAAAAVRHQVGRVGADLPPPVAPPHQGLAGPLPGPVVHHQRRIHQQERRVAGRRLNPLRGVIQATGPTRLPHPDRRRRAPPSRSRCRHARPDSAPTQDRRRGTARSPQPQS
jgi:hypothetical protein